MDSREELKRELKSLGSSLPAEPKQSFVKPNEGYLKNLKAEIERKRKRTTFWSRPVQVITAAAATLAFAIWLFSTQTSESSINYPSEMASFSETEVFVLTEVEVSELELLLSEESENIEAEEILLQEENLEELLNI